MSMKAERSALELAMARSCMSAKDIAEKAQIPEMTVKNVLSGRSVRPRTIGLVCKALGVDVTEIMKKGD